MQHTVWLSESFWLDIVDLELAGFQHIFKNHFPYCCNTKFKKFNTIAFHYMKLLIMKLSFIHCTQVSAKTLHKCFAFSKILLRYYDFFSLEFPYLFNT